MKKLLFVFIVFISIFGFGQLKVTSGNLDFLKDETLVNVVVKQENILYQVENFSEDQYLDIRKKAIFDNPKKTEMDWKNWLNGWNDFKDKQYLDYFLKGLKKSKKIKFDKNVDSKYTLIVEPKWIYAGWHGGFIGQEAKLSSVLTFVETQNPSNTLLVLEGDKILGKPQNKDFVMEYGRIAGAYEETGKKLLTLVKKLK